MQVQEQESSVEPKRPKLATEEPPRASISVYTAIMYFTCGILFLLDIQLTLERYNIGLYTVRCTSLDMEKCEESNGSCYFER